MQGGARPERIAVFSALWKHITQILEETDCWEMADHSLMAFQADEKTNKDIRVPVGFWTRVTTRGHVCKPRELA